MTNVVFLVIREYVETLLLLYAARGYVSNFFDLFNFKIEINPCHPRMCQDSPPPPPPMQQLEDMRRLEECSASTASLGENQIPPENCDNKEKKPSLKTLKQE